MAKDPAFLFYPGDWLGGTMTMTRYHKGAYMDLLMAQFNEGHMSVQQIKTVLGEKDEHLWDEVLKKKFIEDASGLFYNEKLEGEVIKRRNFTESRRKNLSHMDSHMEKHMDVRMENENENRNKDRKKKEKTSHIPPSIEDVTAYCKERNKGVDPQVWYDHYQAKGWMIGKSKMVNWQAAVRTWEKSNGTDPKKPKFGLSPDAAKRIEEIERENAAKSNRA